MMAIIVRKKKTTKYFSRKKPALQIFIIVLQLLLMFSIIETCFGNENNYDEFVQEILNEHEDHYDDNSDIPSMEQEEKIKMNIQHDEEELMMRQKEEIERIERERNEQIQLEREIAFETELAKMAKDKQKLLRKQKQQDAKVVRRVLNSMKNEDYYGVLRLRSIEISIPQQCIHIPFFPRYNITIPSYQLFHISSNDIKKAYRDMAKLIHPDKNHDGRANEAFIAVEYAASILVDDQQRNEYDKKLNEQRKQKLHVIYQKITTSTKTTIRATNQFVSIIHKILGPFAFPVSVVGVLIM